MNRANSYHGVPEEERPPYKGPFGHVRDENYVAPEDNKWQHDDSDSGTENMKDYVAYRAESEAEGSPVAPRRKRPAQLKQKKASQTKAGSSSQRKGKEVVQESEDEETETDSNPDATEIDSETGRRYRFGNWSKDY